MEVTEKKTVGNDVIGMLTEHGYYVCDVEIVGNITPWFGLEIWKIEVQGCYRQELIVVKHNVHGITFCFLSLSIAVKFICKYRKDHNVKFWYTQKRDWYPNGDLYECLERLELERRCQ